MFHAGLLGWGACGNFADRAVLPPGARGAKQMATTSKLGRAMGLVAASGLTLAASTAPAAAQGEPGGEGGPRTW